MKLILDESKIRKGKPIGLPYQGSKKKISKKIIEIIKQNFGTDKPVYDVFGGGGAITAECILNGLEVHYNDLDKTITDMFNKVVSSDREYLKTLIVSRSDFFEIRDKELKSVDDELKLLVNSFGNNRYNYLYSLKYSEIKYNLALEIIEKHDCFSRYKKTKSYNENSYKNIDKNDRLQQFQRLQQLEILQELNIIPTTNKSYEHFSEVENSIIYLDPPYEGTHNGYKFEFDNQKFYDWALKMSNNNIVLISSYEISDNRFEEVYSFDKARGTFKGLTKNSKCEKLFMIK